MPVIEIPEGQATLRDKLTVGGRDRLEVAIYAVQAVMAQVEAQDRHADLKTTRDLLKYVSAEDMRTVQRFNRSLLLAYLKSWTLNEPLPRNDEDIDEMEQDVFQAIVAKANELFTGNRKEASSDMNEESVEDPKAPSASSSDSRQLSEEKSTPSNTENSPSESAPTSTEDASQA